MTWAVCVLWTPSWTWGFTLVLLSRTEGQRLVNDTTVEGAVEWSVLFTAAHHTLEKQLPTVVCVHLLTDRVSEVTAVSDLNPGLVHPSRQKSRIYIKPVYVNKHKTVLQSRADTVGNNM